MSHTFNHVAAIVLAAGKGTRMKSALPKVLHQVAGRTMLDWVLVKLHHLGIKSICLLLSEETSPFSSLLRKYPDLTVAIQKNRLGTGDAIASAAFAFNGATKARYAGGSVLKGGRLEAEYVLILAGDVPAIKEELLSKFVESSLHQKTDVAVLGMKAPNPYGYGRLLMEGSALKGIIEEKDATPEQRKIDICNTGIIFAKTKLLFDLVSELTPNNAQGEYYLTDCVALAFNKGFKTSVYISEDWQQFSGVNDRVQLSELERWMIQQKRLTLMQQGVSLKLPETIYVEPDVLVGSDTTIESHCVLKGQTKIGKDVVIGAGTVLENVTINDGEFCPPYSVMISN